MHDADVQWAEDGYAGADYGGENFGGGPEEHGDRVVDIFVKGGEGLEFVGADYGTDAGTEVALEGVKVEGRLKV